MSEEDLDTKLNDIIDDTDWSDELLHEVIAEIKQLIRQERIKAQEEVYEDVLYRLSFMDAEDKIDDVIADVTHRQSELKQSLEKEKK